MSEPSTAIDTDARSLLETFARLDASGKQQWLAIGRILAGEAEAKT